MSLHRPGGPFNQRDAARRYVQARQAVRAGVDGRPNLPAGTTELVIVPAWRRPDFLTATLRRLAIADDPQLAYWLCLDRGHSPYVASAARDFQRQIGGGRVTLRLAGQHPHRGNSYNVLTAYAAACASGATLIHLVEEDIFAGRDYFAFHRQAHALCPDVFAVSACRNQNVDVAPPERGDAVYQHPAYQSLGVSFTPQRLASILPHIGADYFADPSGYCRATFPDSRIWPGFCEQDGLLHRIAEANGWPVAYPLAPRAYHAGFHSYNRKGVPLSGGVAQRADRLLSMSAADLNAHARDYPDHTTIVLDGERPAVTSLQVWP